MKKLRMAVIGVGRLGGLHAQKLAAREDVELVAVVDPLPSNRNRVAAECRTRAMADYRTLLDQLDAAVIATPTRFHHTVALDCLNHGIHLLVEKPLCARLAEANDLVEVARRERVVLQVGHVERFNPAFMAAAPHLGHPRYVEATRTSGFTCRSTDIGVVLDLMVHDIDLVLALVRSQPRKVDAFGLAIVGEQEDVAQARLEFEGGCVALLSASRVSHEPLRRMQVWSSQAFAAIDFAARTAAITRPSEALRRGEFSVDRLSPQQVEHYQAHFMAEHLPREQMTFAAVDALALELQDFIEGIHTRRVPRVTGAAGRDAVAVAEQILARMHTRAWPEAADELTAPQPVTRPHIIPAPHFAILPQTAPAARKAAG